MSITTMRALLVRYVPTTNAKPVFGLAKPKMTTKRGPLPWAFVGALLAMALWGYVLAILVLRVTGGY